MASVVSDESCNRCVGGAHGPKDSLSMLWLVVVDDDWLLAPIQENEEKSCGRNVGGVYRIYSAFKEVSWGSKYIPSSQNFPQHYILSHVVSEV